MHRSLSIVIAAAAFAGALTLSHGAASAACETSQTGYWVNTNSSHPLRSFSYRCVQDGWDAHIGDLLGYVTAVYCMSGNDSCQVIDTEVRMSSDWRAQATLRSGAYYRIDLQLFYNLNQDEFLTMVWTHAGGRVYNKLSLFRRLLLPLAVHPDVLESSVLEVP